MDIELAVRLGLSLAIGLVVGIERGWRERAAAPGSRTAGVRTYALTGLLGGVFAALALALSTPLIIGVGFAGFIVVFAWFKRAEAREDEDYSVTGTVAAMLVFALGALAVAGDRQLAGAGGIMVAAVLASRDYAHKLLERVTWVELRSALLLLGMSGVVLPLLPDEALGPYDSINPRSIWLFSVFVATLSYAGYVAMRLLGPARGLLVTGVTGGLVSSTAITTAFARRAAQGEPDAALAAGAAAAGATSLLRVLVVVLAVKPALGVAVAAPIVAAAAVFLVTAWLMARRFEQSAGETVLGNPFELVPVVGFALLLMLVGLLAGWMTARFGSAGLSWLALISGLVDVDAVVLSSARLAGEGVEMAAAARAVLLALLSNALARAAYAIGLGSRGYATRLGAVTLGACAAGAAAMVFV